MPKRKTLCYEGEEELPLVDLAISRDVQNALFDRDAGAYVDACLREGIPIDDPYLLETHLADSSFEDIERRRQNESWNKARIKVRADGRQRTLIDKFDEQLSLTERFELLRKGKPLKIPKRFRVTQENLTHLGYLTLKKIYRGLHNLDIPTEMLLFENGAEVVAELMAAGQLKVQNNHLRNPTIPQEFLPLVKYLLNDAMSYSTRSYSGRTSQRFAAIKRIHDLPLVERLEMVPHDAREEFVSSFFSDYIPSKAENPSHPKSYYEPNIDGANTAVYARRIGQSLEIMSENANELLTRSAA